MDLTRMVLVEKWGVKLDLIGFNSEGEERNQAMKTNSSLKICYKGKQKKWWTILVGSRVKKKFFSFERQKSLAAYLYADGKI